jgi:nitrite reductase (NADH) large subunit
MANPAKPKPKLVLIGNGMAGIRTLEELLKIAPDTYDITVFGAEPHGNYNRILLSPVLAGEKTLADILTHPRSWYAEHGITLHTGDPVKTLHRARRVVVSASGVEVPYDRLLIATGSSPFILPVPGHQLQGVIAFRDIKDVDAMLASAKQHKEAVVIGGGLLGLEAANGLMKQGMNVTVVHVMPTLMERQLDPHAAGLLQSALEARGMRFCMNAHTAELQGEEGRVRRIHFKDGSVLPADLVVMAAGVRPNVSLAKEAGLHVERAIVVNDTLQTLSDPRIYAVGECIQHRNAIYGLVAPLWEQANVCATHLAGFGIGRYQGSVVSTKLKVTGISLFSAGDFIGNKDTQDLLFKDPKRGVYKKLVVKDNVLVGAVLYGDTQDGPWYFDLIQSQQNIGAWRSKLVFGKGFCVPEAA